MSVPSGIVLDRSDVVVLDTREMGWEGSPYVSGALRRVLARDDEGDPIIVMRWLTSRITPIPPGRAGEYHTARELFYYLGGDFAHWEQDPQAGHDRVTRRTPFREGYFMDRLEGSVHGGNSDAPRQACGIGWMTHGEDPFVGSAESMTLTHRHEVPAGTAVAGGEDEGAASAAQEELPVASSTDVAAAYAAALALDLPLVRIVRGRELLWEPHPCAPGVLERVLARRADGDPTVSLLWIPPGRFPAARLPLRVSHDYREFSYVLEGELTERSYADAGTSAGEAVRLLPGFWVDRRAGSIHGHEAGDVSPTGCVLLRLRARNGAGFVKEHEKYTVWTRTLTDEPGSRARFATAEEQRAYLRERGRDEAGRLLGEPDSGDWPSGWPR